MERALSLKQMAATAAVMAAVALAPFAAPMAAGQVSPNTETEFTFHHPSVLIRYHRATGGMDIEWSDGKKLLGISSSALLEDGRQISTASYTVHTLDKPQNIGGAQAAEEYTIRSTAPGLPDFLQHIWLYDGQASIAIEAELVSKGAPVGTRHFDPVVLKDAGAIGVGQAKSLRVLHVPFDNDMWFRYNSIAVAGIKSGQTVTSNEVTAIYDNTTRQALVLGSITHDTWKTAIEVGATRGTLTSLDLYGGISSPTGVRTDTHDTVPHGIVRGQNVTSSRIFIGSFADWRDGLEAYGAANAAVHAPLKWAAGAPMGWNSWAAYADKINDHRYLGAAAFVRDTLVPQGFSRTKIIYVNLDAF